MYTDHTLPSDFTMTVDAYDRRLATYFARHSNYSRPILYKEKGRKGRFGEIDEKITREEYALDWSQTRNLKNFSVVL